MEKRRILGLFDLWHDRRGAFAPMAALFMTALLGFGALAIDMGFNYYTRNKLQVTADASALAGASQLGEFLDGESFAVVTDEARDYADKNMAFVDYGNVLDESDVIAGNWDPDTRTFTPAPNPLSPPVGPLNAVMTTTRQQEASNNPVPAFLGGIAGFSSYNIAARAIATWGIGDDLFPSGCIMALSEHEEKAFHIHGTATITASDCNIEVASDANCAMHANGTPTITYVVGEDGAGINVAGTYCEVGTVDIDPPPSGNYQGDIQDPYRNTDPCQMGLDCNAGCDFNDTQVNGTTTFAPGVYCGGIKVNGNGTVTFQPGDYIIREGKLDIGGSMDINASGGVGFYLQGTGSTVDIGGSSGNTGDTKFVAQDNGSALDGFIFYEEKKNPKEEHSLRGTSGGSYEGVLYFTGDVELKGTADVGLGGAESDCTILIASTVYFNGTTGLDANSTCSGFESGAPAGVGDMMVRLVE